MTTDIAAPTPGKSRALQPTIGGSTYVDPESLEWKPTRFDRVWIKVLYENAGLGEMTCLLKMEPGASIPFHRHPELEQTLVLSGSMRDHDGVANAGDYIWRKPGSYHDNTSDTGCVALAIYRKPNIFFHATTGQSAGF